MTVDTQQRNAKREQLENHPPHYIKSDGFEETPTIGDNNKIKYICMRSPDDRTRTDPTTCVIWCVCTQVIDDLTLPFYEKDQGYASTRDVIGSSQPELRASDYQRLNNVKLPPPPPFYVQS